MKLPIGIRLANSLTEISLLWCIKLRVPRNFFDSSNIAHANFLLCIIHSFAGGEDSEPMLARICGIFVTNFPQFWVPLILKVLQGDPRGSYRALLWVWGNSGCYIRCGGTKVTLVYEEYIEDGDTMIWMCHQSSVIGVIVNRGSST